jgi:hypothetical protein
LLRGKGNAVWILTRADEQRAADSSIPTLPFDLRQVLEHAAGDLIVRHFPTCARPRDKTRALQLAKVRVDRVQ